MVPPAAGLELGASLHEHLIDFLTSRAVGDKRDDILGGHPWLDEDRGYYWFRMKDLHRSFDRGRLPERGDILKVLKRVGGKSKPLKVKGETIRCWRVPTSAIGLAVVLDTPVIPKEPI